MSCVSNALAGREATTKVTAAERSRRVLVAGGGPAGLEAARVAALRGHTVALYEEGPRLGGMLNAGSVPPHKYELPNLVRYFETQLTKLGVAVELERRVSPETLAEAAPDVVVVATGGQLISLPVEAEAGFAVSVTDALLGRTSLGSRVAVLGGSGTGCEVAEHLAEKGHAVTVVEMMEDYATDIRPEVKRLMAKRFKQLGVEVMLGCKVTAVRQGEVVYERSGQEGKVEGLDSVVFALGSRPDRRLLEAAQASGIEAYSAGDCEAPGNIYNAVHRAFDVALAL